MANTFSHFFLVLRQQGRTSAPPVREVGAFHGDALGRADLREQQRLKTGSAGGRQQKTLNYPDKNRKNRRISDVSSRIESDSNSIQDVERNAPPECIFNLL